MNEAVELVNTASKVGIKLDKNTLVAATVGATLGAGVVFGVNKWRARKEEQRLNEIVAE